jgi:hypothetical protein
MTILDFKKCKFSIHYRKESSKTVDYPKLVSLIIEKGTSFKELRFNNPVCTNPLCIGENRTRQLNGDEMLALWRDVARITPKS